MDKGWLTSQSERVKEEVRDWPNWMKESYSLNNPVSNFVRSTSENAAGSSSRPSKTKAS